MEPEKSIHQPVGTKIHRYLGIPVYENGADKNFSHGPHYSDDDGYYYGQKWQCVEFVKRFYDQALNHRMPHVWGHAKDFFDHAIEPGEMNRRRGLVQYRNRGNTSPEVYDILVFSNTVYGHLAIVSHVWDNAIEVVQQNIAGQPLQRLNLTRIENTFFVHTPRTPDGWLRLKRHDIPPTRNAR